MSKKSTQFRKSNDDAVQRALRLRDKKLKSCVSQLKSMHPVEAALELKGMAKRSRVHKDDLKAAWMEATR
jgi:hypothetical protein